MPITDPYTSHLRLKRRLRDELTKYGKLIVAVDFDDTVYDTHENGWRYEGVIDTIKRWQGADKIYLICWTASLPERYQFIIDYFDGAGIKLDAINENAPWIEAKGPKIYANIYLDDRTCGLQECITILNELYQENKREGMRIE
jgi:hypothetical protein